MKKILVVDDDEDIASYLKEVLLKDGYALDFSKTGQSALRLFSEGAYDLVLLDLRLPDMDGLEVCQKMKGDVGRGFAPIIMISSFRETEDRIKSLSSGAVYCIQKPFSPEMLKAKIKSVLKLQEAR